MDKIIEIISGFPDVVQGIIVSLFIVWAFEIFCLPFNINRLIERVDKVNKALDEILKLVGNDSSIRADNSKVLSLLLGDILENRSKNKEKTRNEKKD